MGNIRAFALVATPFDRSGAFDVHAFRAHLQRLVEADIGVILASAGAGEADALSAEELKRLYEVGVEVCHGKVPVHAQGAEQHVPEEALRRIGDAAQTGVDLVSLPQLAGWHGMRPTDRELNAYFDHVLSAIDARVAIVIDPHAGYVPAPKLIAELCARYPAIEAIRVSAVAPGYLSELRDLAPRPLAYHVATLGAPASVRLGATGVFGPEANILPKTFRSFVANLEGDARDADDDYRHLARFERFVRAWDASSPRWIKMAMDVLKLPGGEGGLREPYRMPSERERQAFADGLRRLAIPELDERLRAAGAAVRSAA
jgi:dihydrodipicolinate synthase/N-acetylneuraminate lyase